MTEITATAVNTPASNSIEVDNSKLRLTVGGRPLVLSPAKKKRKYSKELRGIQNLIRNVSKLGGRATSSVANGVNEFRKRSEKSAEKRKDGMLKDLVKNGTKGLNKTLKTASKLPGDIITVVIGKGVQRRVGKAVRFVLK